MPRHLGRLRPAALSAIALTTLALAGCGATPVAAVHPRSPQPAPGGHTPPVQAAPPPAGAMSPSPAGGTAVAMPTPDLGAVDQELRTADQALSAARSAAGTAEGDPTR